MSFRELGLSEPLLRAVSEQGYQVPTPIQARAIPAVLAGRDVLGCAQTGTGKTAAFALPLLERLAASSGGRRVRGQAPRCLVVSPTRELALQIAEDARAYARHLPIRSAVLFGGVNQRSQVDALRRGADVVVATPGRLLDLLEQGHLVLNQVSHLVLDEADRMLDMGFLPDVRRIIKALPAREQTLLFSATMPREIAQLADSLLSDPVKVAVAPTATAAETVAQRVYLVAREDKPALLNHLLTDPALARVLVFTRTKHGADRLCHKLERGGVPCAAIHGNKSQNARQRALEGFRRGAVRVLVASDIAARGLDIDDVSHVINFDVPNEPETYVHRIGRTGRAGASGEALSFCSHEERGFLRAIEKIVRQKVPVEGDHPYRAQVRVDAADDRRASGDGRADGDGRRSDRPARNGRPGGAGRRTGPRRAGSALSPSGGRRPGRRARVGRR